MHIKWFCTSTHFGHSILKQVWWGDIPWVPTAKLTFLYPSDLYMFTLSLTVVPEVCIVDPKQTNKRKQNKQTIYRHF